jgi:hypothetical protein
MAPVGSELVSVFLVAALECRALCEVAQELICSSSLAFALSEGTTSSSVGLTGALDTRLGASNVDGDRITIEVCELPQEPPTSNTSHPAIKILWSLIIVFDRLRRQSGE